MKKKMVCQQKLTANYVLVPIATKFKITINLDFQCFFLEIC